MLPPTGAVRSPTLYLILCAAQPGAVALLSTALSHGMTYQRIQRSKELSDELLAIVGEGREPVACVGKTLIVRVER